MRGFFYGAINNMHKIDRPSAVRRLMEYPQDYLGVAEVAAVFGMSTQAISNRNTRGRMPKPDAKLAIGPIWSKLAIADYLNSPRLNQYAPSQRYK
jgi:hypothetical protein